MNKLTPRFNALLEKYSFLIKEQEAEPVNPPPESALPTGDEQPQAPAPTEQDDQTVDQAEANKTSQGYAYLTNVIYNLLTFPSESLPKSLLGLSEEKVTNKTQAFQVLNKIVDILPADLKVQLLQANFGGSGALQVTDQDIIEMANVALRSLFYSDKLSNEFTGLKDDIKSEINKSGNKVSTENSKTIYNRIKELVGVEVNTQE